MKLNAYTVYDRKALQYHAPFYAVADGAAVRSFQDLANDPQTTIGRHPADYTLYGCGAFDDESGQLLPDQPRHIVDAFSLVRTPAASLPFDPPLGSSTAGNGSLKE